jgi:hypothetical protein
MGVGFEALQGSVAVEISAEKSTPDFMVRVVGSQYFFQLHKVSWSDK